MPKWLENLADEIWEWFLTVRVLGQPGWVRFCREGALFEPGDRAGLGMSCLALKTLYMLNLLDRLSPGELEDWIAYIHSFQTVSGRSAGYFEDQALLRVVDRWWRRDWATRRAETRQACAALLSVDARPKAPIRSIPRSPRDVRQFIRQLPWETPWVAGSHASHLMFFLHVNATVFGENSTEKILLPVILEKLEALQDPETGSWFTGNPSPEQMINGAMKVITGYSFLSLPFRHADRLIDFALTLANDYDACHHTDLIYVLHQCSRLSGHRLSEVHQVAEQRLADIIRFRRRDGAFSFRPEGSGLVYYGVPMSRGLPVSDIHGTTLFVWALVMIADILGWRAELGWRLPVT